VVPARQPAEDEDVVGMSRGRDDVVESVDMSWRRLSAIAVVTTLFGCGGSSPQPQSPVMPGVSGPGLSATLTSGCFGWPATDFSPSNSAAVQTALRAGDRAVAFGLRDVNGTPVTLSSLLASRPVLLVNGAFT
jgi:hypothetical protein